MEPNASTPGHPDRRACRRCGRPVPMRSRASVCPRCMMQSQASGGEPDRSPDSAPPVTSAAIPLRLGDYLLEQEVAHGGMGVVYRARQLSLGRTVAVKLLLLGRHSSAESIERFRREARSAAALRHPHIVSVFEVGESDGQHYLSMEWVEGDDLARRLQGGPLPVRLAAEYLRTLALAVQYAHERGVLHRDLKPSNVLIDPFGEPRLTDFGLAKPMDGSSDLTETGRLLGSPNYLSPEAAAGRVDDVGPASDVYSLGALFYELLTGRPPFLSQSLQDTLLNIRDREPVGLRRLNPAVPADLETICLKCLEKHPSARYASAQALADDLDRWLRHEPIRARPVPPWERGWKWAHRNPRLAVSMLGTVAAGLGLMLTLSVANARIRAANAQTAVEAETSRQRLIRLNVQTGNRLVEDGDPHTALAWFVEALALERGNPELEDVHRRRIGAVLRMTPALEGLWFHDAFVNEVRISPDGHRVAAISQDSTARLWRVDDGASLWESVKAFGVHFSPDNRHLMTWTQREGSRLWKSQDGSPVAGWPKSDHLLVHFGSTGSEAMYPTREGVVRVDVDSGEFIGGPLRTTVPPVSVEPSADGRWVVGYGIPERLTVWNMASPEAPRWTRERLGGPRSLVLSRDSRRVAMVVDQVRVRQWNLADGSAVGPDLVRPDQVYAIDYSPDGERLATAEWAGAAMIWDAATGTPVGPPLVHQGGVRQVRYSPEGHHLVTASWDTTVRFWDPGSGAPRPFRLRHGGFVTSLDFSGDGSRMVTGCQDSAVRLWRLPGPGLAVRVLDPGGQIVRVRYHPHGTAIVTASREGTVRIWGRAPGPPLATLRLPGPVNDVEYSPDGTRLLTACGAGSAALWDSGTGKALGIEVVHGLDLRGARFSPDGTRFLTYGRNSIRLWESATGAPMGPALELEARIHTVDFHPAGRRLLVGDERGVVSAWELGGSPRVAFRLEIGGTLREARYSPDGRRVLTARSDAGQLPSAAQTWDAESGVRLPVEMGHLDGLYVAKFSADGRWVVTGGEDNTARVWNAETGMPVTPPLRHRTYVNDALFSPDGRLLVTVSAEGIARLWESASGERVPAPFDGESGVAGGCWSPDGREIALVNRAVGARLYDVSPFDGPVEILKLRAEILASQRIVPGSGATPLTPVELRERWDRLVWAGEGDPGLSTRPGQRVFQDFR